MGLRITEFVELLTGLTANDFLAIVNGGVSKKIKVGTLFADYVKKSNTGMLSMRNVGQPLIQLTTSFTKIPYGGIVSIDKANGHMEFIDNTMTVHTNGDYAIRTFGSVGIPNNIDVEFSYFRNGEEVNPDVHPVFTGAGIAKPISIGDGIVLELLATDTLEIFARASSAVEIALLYTSSSIEKKVF